MTTKRERMIKMGERLVKENEEWLERTIDTRGPMSLRSLWLLWAKEMGSADNIVVWPKLHVTRAMVRLVARGILKKDMPERGGSAA
jgi:hypothetical protein